MKRNSNVKSVVVYSMGHDGSAAIADALGISEEIQMRQIYTLNRSTLANFMLRHTGEIPEHIRHSEMIIKKDLPNEVPLHFITMVPNPFTRHIRQTFYFLRNQLEPDLLEEIISNSERAVEIFASLPTEQTTEWFSTEYLKGVGIDIYAESIDHLQGYKIFSVGVHKLLLLSSHLSTIRQTEIISGFLEVDVQQILTETSMFDNIRKYYAGQVMLRCKDTIIERFWTKPYTTHFFSPFQISEFQKEAEATIFQSHALKKVIEEKYSTSTRDELLKNTLSSLQQLPYLISSAKTLINKRGTSAARSVVSSILNQLERAQRKLLLASMRAFSESDVHVSVELGETFYSLKPDERIIKALAAYTQRTGAIKRPLQLLESLTVLDDPQALTHQRLLSQNSLLTIPFDFSVRGQTRYKPKKHRILYNATLALPYHTSGYATRTQGIVKGLNQSGWDVQVVTRKGYPLDTGLTLKDGNEAEIEKIKYFYDDSKGQGQHETPLKDYIESAAQYLVEKAQESRPLLIHTASNYLCGMAGIEAARRLGVPSIYEMRGLWHITRCSKEPSYADSEHFALAQKMELETALAADHVFAITNALKEWLVEHNVPETKITVIPNAVDINQFVKLKRDKKYARSFGCLDKIVIGYIGSFVQYEGLDLLLQAVALLPHEVRQKIVLLWVGDGPALKDLTELADTLGISENILAIGRKPFSEIPKLYSLVDICVFPRKGQRVCEIISPLKPFEAMAMEKAVIVSDVRLLREIIEPEKTGLVHLKDDVTSLSQQLYRFIDDESLRMRCGKAAREWVEQTRSWQIISRTITEIYTELTK